MLACLLLVSASSESLGKQSGSIDGRTPAVWSLVRYSGKMCLLLFNQVQWLLWTIQASPSRIGFQTRFWVACVYVLSSVTSVLTLTTITSPVPSYIIAALQLVVRHPLTYDELWYKTSLVWLNWFVSIIFSFQNRSTISFNCAWLDDTTTAKQFITNESEGQ